MALPVLSPPRTSPLPAVCGEPRIDEAREWWTPSRFTAVIEACQQELRSLGPNWSLVVVATRLSISVTSLRMYMSGERPIETIQDRTLFAIVAGVDGILGGDWLGDG